MLERTAAFLVAVIVLVLSFFFVAAAVAFVLVLAVVLAVHLWWLKRKLKQTAEREFITTEYTVVEREAQQEAQPPPDGR